MSGLELLRERLAQHDCDPRGSDQITARCPAHADGKPSLSAGLGDDGRVLLTCHTGCETERILAELGLTWADLFADDGSRNGREIADIYDYVDERGGLLYQVVRYAPKRFAQRRPDGNGGWIWKLDETRRVLYRLPNVIAAIEAGEPVYVVEGEKDVIAIERAGAVATCNPMGAGKWRREFTQALSGADAIVVADQDDPGRAHADAVATALDGVARALRVVEPVEGKDATDHLAAGHGLDEFTVVEPGMEPAPTSVITKASSVRTRRVEWAWPGRWPIGYLTIQTGEEKIGKSVLFAKCAADLTHGRLDGAFRKPTPVLIVAVEDALDNMWVPRLTVAGADLDLVAFLKIPDTWNVKDGIGLIEQGLDESKAQLLFVDAVMEHLPEARGGENANSVTFVRNCLRPLARMSAERDVASVISTHPPKRRATTFGDYYAASAAFTQVSRSCLVFAYHPDDQELPEEQQRRVLLRPRSSFGRAPGTLSFRLTAESLVLDDGKEDEIVVATDLEQCSVTIRDLLRADRTGQPDADGREQGKQAQLEQIIAEYLADGEWHPSLEKTLKASGWKHGTIQAARSKIARADKEGGTMNGGWLWRLKDGPSLHSTDSSTLPDASRAGRVRTNPDSSTLLGESPVGKEESKSQSSATKVGERTFEESKSQSATHIPRTPARGDDSEDNEFISEVLRRHGGEQ